MKTSIKIILVSVIIALVIITAGCVSNDTGNTPTAAPTKTASPTPVQTFYPDDTENPLEPAVKSSFSVTVSENYPDNVTNLMKVTSSRNKLANESEYSYLLNLWITCKNISGADSIDFDPYEDVYLSVDGVNYKAKSSTKYPKYYDEMPAAVLKEGNSVSGWLYFIVPAGFAKVNMNAEGMESNYVDLIYG